MKTYDTKKDKFNDLLEHRKINLAQHAPRDDMPSCPTLCVLDRKAKQTWLLVPKHPDPSPGLQSKDIN